MLHDNLRSSGGVVTTEHTISTKMGSQGPPKLG